MRKNKRQPEAAFVERARLRGRLLLDADAGELVAELLDATAQGVHALLRAGVERMRLARRLDLQERQLAAVFHLDRLAGLRGGARHELEAVRQVDEADLAIAGVDAFFHGNLCAGMGGSHAQPLSALTACGKRRIIAGDDRSAAPT